MRPRLIALPVSLASARIALTATAQAALKVTWMPGAYPHNAFLSHLIPFLRTVSTSPS